MNAVMTYDEKTVKIEGKLVAEKGEDIGVGFCLTYTLSENVFTLTAAASEEGVILYIPVVSRETESIIKSTPYAFTFQKENAELSIICDGDIKGISYLDMKTRSFNPVGGFTYFPIEISLKKDTPAQVKILV